MLNDVDLDVVSVCTPNYIHKDPTIAAFKAGVHVRFGWTADSIFFSRFRAR